MLDDRYVDWFTMGTWSIFYGVLQVSLHLFFWICLNVGVPLVGPVFTLALAAPTHGFAVTKRLIMEAIGSGQLLWTSNALSAATLCEAVLALPKHPGAAVGIQLAIALSFLICFACSIIVTMSMVKTHIEKSQRAPRRRATSRGQQPAAPKDPPFCTHAPGLMLKVSIYVAALCALLSIALHTYTTEVRLESSPLTF